MKNIKQEIEIKKIDFLNVFLVEFKAIIRNKYKVNFFNPIYDKKDYWEIYKPKFYFDMYPESIVHNTAWVMEIFYIKITRTV